MNITSRVSMTTLASIIGLVLISACTGPAGPAAPVPEGGLRLSGHSSWVINVAWSPDGKQLASASFDRSVRVWDVSGRNTVKSFSDFGGGAEVVAWSPDGKYLAAGSHDRERPFRVWDTQTWERVLATDPTRNAVNSATVNSITWSPDSKQVAVGLQGTSMKGRPFTSWVKLYESDSWQNTYTLTRQRGVGTLSWSPDGARLAFTTEPPKWSGDSLVTIWDISPAGPKGVPGTPETHDLDVVNDIVVALEWSPDSKLVAVSSTSNEVYVQDVETGATLQTLTGHTMTVESVAWSPDGRYLATGASDTEVRIWDATSGQTVAVFDYPDVVHSVAWSPDGETLAVGCADKNVYLQAIDAANGGNGLSGANRSATP